MKFYAKNGQVCKTYIGALVKDVQDKVSEIKENISHVKHPHKSSSDDTDATDDSSDPRYKNAKIQLNPRTNTIDIVGRSSGEVLDSYEYWNRMNDCKKGSSINELSENIDIDESDDD